MIIKTDYSTTTVYLTTQDALELIRQLADAVSSATRRNGVSSFASGATVQAADKYNPGVLHVVVDVAEKAR